MEVPLLANEETEEQVDPPAAATSSTKKKGAWKKRLFHKKKNSGRANKTPSSSNVADDSSADSTSKKQSSSEEFSILSSSHEQQQQEVVGMKEESQEPKEEYSSPVKDTDDDDDILQLLQRPSANLQQQSEPPPASPTPQTSGGDRNVNVRSVLSRPFGRTNLAARLPRKSWVIEVSPAEWDGDENRWKYRILVQRRDTSQQQQQPDEQQQVISSFTTAFTWRSLADFCWLEKALRAEYHGALMLPLLSIAIGTADLANTQYEVDSQLLKDWLTDVLNGVRGQGELILDMESVNLMSSEAMEAFLYRNTDPLPAVNIRGTDLNVNASLYPTSSLDLPWKENNSGTGGEEEHSFVDFLWTKPFLCLPLDSVCPQPIDSSEASSTNRQKQRSDSRTMHLPLELGFCSSRAVGQAALDDEESFVELSNNERGSSTWAIHSELLEAERELVSSYRKSAMASMEKARVLIEEETQVGAAWKRFAISLSNLFAFEKDIEAARIGGKEKKDNMPYRKVSKSDVDDCLRMMARQKMERSTPSLREFNTMLGAYLGDLTAVNPSINAYSEAVVHLARLKEVPHNNNNMSETGGNSWQQQMRALASEKLADVKSQIAFSSGASFGTATTSSTDLSSVTVHQKRAFQNRVLGNERLLRGSVTALCTATPIRVARIAWTYFKMEAGQAALMNGASIAMRTKLNTATPKAVSSMKERHQKESAEDDATELALVQRIVNIANNTKFLSSASQNDTISLESDASVELDTDQRAEAAEKGLLRDKALQIAREQPGRWDAKLALAIMEAVGIDDAEVRVEETTRDLRLVRTYAIGLRENLNRCVEAVDNLSSVVVEGDLDAGVASLSLEEEPYDEEHKRTHRIHDTRRDFIVEASRLLSGVARPNESTTNSKPKSASPSISVLANAGIDTSDPAGWSRENEHRKKQSTDRGHCGDLAVAYLNKRDSNVEVLLTRISDQLEEYQKRVEGIESFVYMQCVGIQLEKNFNQKRADTLAAWEKKTDITTAINIATRKRLPLLVNELESKLDNVSPPSVSHTTVKKTKEMHLVSKTLKSELADLANRRFLRTREAATERAIALMTLWAEYEEDTTNEEINAIGETIFEIERTVKSEDIPPFLLQNAT